MAEDDFYSVDEGGVLLAQVTPNDPETCDFAIVVFDEPDHAQGFGFVFDQSSGAFVYEPDPGFVGTDSFRYGDRRRRSRVRQRDDQRRRDQLDCTVDHDRVPTSHADDQPAWRTDDGRTSATADPSAV